MGGGPQRCGTAARERRGDRRARRGDAHQHGAGTWLRNVRGLQDHVQHSQLAQRARDAAGALFAPRPRTTRNEGVGNGEHRGHPTCRERMGSPTLQTTARSNLAAALGLLSRWRLSKPQGMVITGCAPLRTGEDNRQTHTPRHLPPPSRGEEFGLDGLGVWCVECHQLP